MKKTYETPQCDVIFFDTPICTGFSASGSFEETLTRSGTTADVISGMQSGSGTFPG